MGRARRAKRAEHGPAACCLLGADNGWIWGARGERSEPSMGLLPAACCLLPDDGFDSRYGGQKKPNFMLYNILLTVIVLIIVIDVILLRQLFVYVLDIYYLCSDFKTI